MYLSHFLTELSAECSECKVGRQSYNRDTHVIIDFLLVPHVQPKQNQIFNRIGTLVHTQRYVTSRICVCICVCYPRHSQSFPYEQFMHRNHKKYNIYICMLYVYYERVMIIHFIVAIFDSTTVKVHPIYVSWCYCFNTKKINKRILYCIEVR